MNCNLGDEVMDTVTGFKGTCCVISIWLNGCRRIGIQSKDRQESGLPVDMYIVDEHQIKVLKAEKHEPKRDTGGPQQDKVAIARRKGV